MQQTDKSLSQTVISAKTTDDAISQILSLSEEADEQNRLNIVVELKEKSYTLTSPLVLSATQHPKLAFINLTLKGDADVCPSVTSCNPITEEYIPVSGTPYFKCQLKKDESGRYPRFHDLYFKGKRLKMATSPTWLNKEALSKEERGTGYIVSDGVYFCDAPAAAIDRRGLYVPLSIANRVAMSESDATELRMYVQWEHYILRVTGVDLADIREFDGETYALVLFDKRFVSDFVHGIHRANNTMNRITFFKNDVAFLTEKNTYVYDWNNGVLYFIVDTPADLGEHKLFYPTLDSLIEIDGMSNVCIQNLSLTGVSSSYVCDNGYYALLSNVERGITGKTIQNRLRNAAIVTSNVRNLNVESCVFHAIGCNAIQMCDRTVRARIFGNRFVDVAMSAVSLGNPTRMWNDPQNQSFAISVINNYFEHIAYDYPNAAVIFLGICDGSQILHNTICGCGYSGIFGGWGWSNVNYEPGEGVNLRDIEIAYNRISNFMELCRDGAAIYMTGANSTLSCGRRFNIIHDNYAFLNDGDDPDKRGYYLDGSATNYGVYDNVIINCATPLFTQYSVKTQYTHHITVKNIYSTTMIHPDNHKPENDVLLENAIVETDGAETLFQRYPEARQIAKNSGCDTELYK